MTRSHDFPRLLGPCYTSSNLFEHRRLKPPQLDATKALSVPISIPCRPACFMKRDQSGLNFHVYCDNASFRSRILSTVVSQTLPFDLGIAIFCFLRKRRVLHDSVLCSLVWECYLYVRYCIRYVNVRNLQLSP